MKIRAVIFDIYNTLLEIGPPTAEAETLWTELCRSALHAKPRLNLNRFGAACQKVIAREHAEARKSGIVYPEIFWPAVACEALPELARLKPNPLHNFLVKHAALQRSVRLMPGAAAVLRALSREKKLLGLASNSQPYTLTELDGSLAGWDFFASVIAKTLSPLTLMVESSCGIFLPSWKEHISKTLSRKIAMSISLLAGKVKGPIQIQITIQSLF